MRFIWSLIRFLLDAHSLRPFWEETIPGLYVVAGSVVLFVYLGVGAEQLNNQLRTIHFHNCYLLRISTNDRNSSYVIL